MESLDWLDLKERQEPRVREGCKVLVVCPVPQETLDSEVPVV